MGLVEELPIRLLSECVQRRLVKPHSCTVDPVCEYYDSPNELIEALELILKDAKGSLKKGILDYDKDFLPPKKGRAKK